jgi:hypothetical protein
MPILRFVSVNHQTCPRLDHSGLNLASPLPATITVNAVQPVTGTSRFAPRIHGWVHGDCTVASYSKDFIRSQIFRDLTGKYILDSGSQISNFPRAFSSRFSK